MDYNIQLVDVPKMHECEKVFQSMLRKAPGHIKAETHSTGSHGGTGTSWAGGYTTWEIYDSRRREWPTEEAEQWRSEIEWAIVEHLQQQKERKVR